VDNASGLRERKKRQTRQLIADTARRLFTEQGFDAVTVAAVAAAADVSEGTVFNYFPTKEDLFFDGMERYEVKLLEAIRDRAPGESVLAAFGRFGDEQQSRLANADVRPVITASARLINASQALQNREREIVSAYTKSLAAIIGEETGAAPDDIEPWVAANAIMGVHQALRDSVRHRVLAGSNGPDITTVIRVQAQRAVALLEQGLGTYAVRSPKRDGPQRRSPVD
jgi:AcrR family transcriptional regulator